MKATSKRRHSEEGVPDRIRSDRRRVLRKHFTIAARAMCPVHYRLSCAEHTHLHRLRSQSAIKTLAALFANGVGKDMTALYDCALIKGHLKFENDFSGSRVTGNSAATMSATTILYDE